MSSLVLNLAADVVAAHVANNRVPVEDLPKLIREVHRALSGAHLAAAAAPKGEPVIPVRQSVKASHLVCLDCGKHFSMLKRHLMTDHQLTPAQYRQKWDLPASYPVVAPDYAKVRSALAKKIGLGRKAAGKKAGRKSSRQS